MSRFGDLIKGVNKTPEVKVPAPVVEEAPVVDTAPVSVEQDDEIEQDDEVDFKSMSKVDLEEYGHTLGIELDKRKNKGKLIEQIYDRLAEL